MNRAALRALLGTVLGLRLILICRIRIIIAKAITYDYNHTINDCKNKIKKQTCVL